MNQSKRRFARARVFACCCIWLLLSAPALCAQDFSSVDADLSQLENLIADTVSDLSAKYEKSSKFWRTFTLIAVPAAALLSGGIVLAATQ
jgi:hypothetical protein